MIFTCLGLCFKIQNNSPSAFKISVEHPQARYGMAVPAIAIGKENQGEDGHRPRCRRALALRTVQVRGLCRRRRGENEARLVTKAALVLEEGATII